MPSGAARTVLLAVFAATATAQSHAQTWPAKAIRFIAPTAPGSPPDVRARWLAERLAPALGQPLVVENRPGAAGNIGTEAAAKAPPDGYTIVIVHQGIMVLNPHVYEKIGFDSLNDLAPVTRVAVSAMLLAVHPTVQANTVRELVALAKASPGKLKFGSGGTASPPHLAVELFNRTAGIDAMHIPFKSASFALTDLMAGRVDYTIDGVVLQVPQVKTGRIRALAVTSNQRLASLPDVPTVAEAGLPGYEYWSWMGICVPAATPRPLIDRLNAELGKILRTQEARVWLALQGGEPIHESPESFAAYMRTEYAKWGKIIRDAGIRIE